MSSIKPIKLNGVWDDGYALDKHMISSVPVGVDGYGNTQFHSVRTDLGELVYQYKYRKNRDCLDRIIRLSGSFIKRWLMYKNIDVVLPVPPTDKSREFQPVFEIAKRVAHLLNTSYCEDLLIKRSAAQSKNLGLTRKGEIEGTVVKTGKVAVGCNTLLVDDLFQSGATLTECVRALRRDQNTNRVYVLAMTKTKGG